MIKSHENSGKLLFDIFVFFLGVNYHFQNGLLVDLGTMIICADDGSNES